MNYLTDVCQFEKRDLSLALTGIFQKLKILKVNFCGQQEFKDIFSEFICGKDYAQLCRIIDSYKKKRRNTREDLTLWLRNLSAEISEHFNICEYAYVNAVDLSYFSRSEFEPYIVVGPLSFDGDKEPVVYSVQEFETVSAILESSVKANKAYFENEVVCCVARTKKEALIGAKMRVLEPLSPFILECTASTVFNPIHSITTTKMSMLRVPTVGHNFSSERENSQAYMPELVFFDSIRLTRGNKGAREVLDNGAILPLMLFLEKDIGVAFSAKYFLVDCVEAVRPLEINKVTLNYPAVE